MKTSWELGESIFPGPNEGVEAGLESGDPIFQSSPGNLHGYTSFETLHLLQLSHFTDSKLQK